MYPPTLTEGNGSSKSLQRVRSGGNVRFGLCISGWGGGLHGIAPTEPRRLPPNTLEIMVVSERGGGGMKFKSIIVIFRVDTYDVCWEGQS